MTKAEILNWLIFAFCAAGALAVYLSYRKTADIITPFRRPGVAYSPDQYKLAFETVEFNTSDGIRLRGWFIPSETESSRTIVFCHGWGSNRGEMLRDTHFLARQGYNLLYFDFRASGESKGSVSSVGYLETRDFDAAYGFLKAHRPLQAERVAVFGTSMGGSVAIYAAGKYPEIEGLLSENTFLSYKRVIANWAWNRMKTPYFPLVALTLFFVRRRLKIDPEPFSPIHNIGKIKCHAMFINGDADDLVPLHEAEALYGLCPSAHKRMWVIAGASHAKCAEVGGEVYKQKVLSFFSENFSEKPAAAPSH